LLKQRRKYFRETAPKLVFNKVEVKGLSKSQSSYVRKLLGLKKNSIITFEELKDFTSNVIKKQMAQFGQMNPTDEDVQGIVARVMSNQDEVKRLSEQVMSQKMLNLFKDKVKAKAKEVSYDEFIKAMYGELNH
jgi:trigger factor